MDILEDKLRRTRRKGVDLASLTLKYLRMEKLFEKNVVKSKQDTAEGFAVLHKGMVTKAELRRKREEVENACTWFFLSEEAREAAMKKEQGDKDED